MHSIITLALRISSNREFEGSIPLNRLLLNRIRTLRLSSATAKVSFPMNVAEVLMLF